MASSGGWPWTIHALVLEIETRNDQLLVYATKASVLRNREAPPTIASLLCAAAVASGTPLDVWMYSELYVDVTGTVKAPRGWTLRVSAESGPKLHPVACERDRGAYSQAPEGAQPLAMQLPL